MWALRRSAYPLRECCQNIAVARTCCAYSNIVSNLEPGEERQGKSFRIGKFVLAKSFSCGSSASAKSFLWTQNLSSEAGAKSSDYEDDLDDGFSELEVAPQGEKVGDISEKEEEEDFMSEGAVSEEGVDFVDDSSLGLSDTEYANSSKGEGRKQYLSQLVKIIMEAPRQSLSNELDKWVENGNALRRGEKSLVMFHLRRRRLYSKALQFVEWLESNKSIELVERDYASHLDLIAKVLGLQKAEKYIEKVPNSFRGEVIYRTLLANCVAAVNVKKSEEVFNKIRDLGFPLTTFACNQLLLLYKRVDRKKIADVLLMMEKENVKPSLFTYQLLIDTRGRANDISGMEQIVETMKAEGVEPDIHVLALVVKYYIYGGHEEKALAALKDMEGDDLSKKNRAACKELLPLYAALGSPEDIERVWNYCSPPLRMDECLAAIEAWGKVGKIEKAEEVFHNLLTGKKKHSPKCYNSLLKVYADNKLLTKGKELAMQMSNNGCKIGSLTLDALVKLYVEAGEVEKADSILQKAAKQNQSRPLYSSYITVLDKYALRGDIHNAEKIFHRLRQIGYVGRMKQYQTLLQAYINAKKPAYGFRERMKADNMFPNKSLAGQLAAVDAFKNTQISDLLD